MFFFLFGYIRAHVIPYLEDDTHDTLTMRIHSKLISG